MKALTYNLKLLEPLLATQTQNGEPNSSVTYPFIPGSMVRGAIINAWIKNTESELNASDRETRNRFFNGSTQYLNAYPARLDGNTRGLPRPLSWLLPKDEADNPEATPLFDFSVDLTQLEDIVFKPPAKGDFCWAKNGVAYLDAPKLQTAVHNASDDPDYKTENISQVYRYDALAPGQIFAGAVLSDNEAILNDIKTLLETYTFNLGGSVTAGYGRVDVFNVHIDDQWQEYKEDAFDNEEDENGFTNLPDESLAIVTCLSDVILLDKTGNYTTDLPKFIGCEERKSAAFVKTRIAGGFNRKWGLPLDQALAIQSGSVFVFSADCYNILKNLVAAGIGERRAEGFGRIAVNWHRRPAVLRAKMPDKKATANPPEILSSDSRKLAQTMAKRQLKAKVEIALTRVINDYSSKLTHLPSASQLSNARLAATRAWRAKKLTPISDYFDGLKKLTRREWEETRIAGEKFMPWAIKLVNNPAGFQLDFGELPVVAGESANFDELRVETIARLVEGVLRRAEKQAKDETAQGGQHD